MNNEKNKYTFEQCCLDNERQDILDRWDYELNSILPSEVSAKTDKKYWFKCPRGIHESELKTISGFAYGKAKEIKCIKCNSFAQHCIDKYGEEYFNKIWSSDNIVSPWEVSYGSKNNTPEQLDINEERKKCGFNELFDVYKYLEMMKIKAMDSDIKKPVINF